jgi:hypothetical protein
MDRVLKVIVAMFVVSVTAVGWTLRRRPGWSRTSRASTLPGASRGWIASGPVQQSNFCSATVLLKR